MQNKLNLQEPLTGSLIAAHFTGRLIVPGVVYIGCLPRNWRSVQFEIKGIVGPRTTPKFLTVDTSNDILKVSNGENLVTVANYTSGHDPYTDLQCRPNNHLRSIIPWKHAEEKGRCQIYEQLSSYGAGFQILEEGLVFSNNYSLSTYRLGHLFTEYGILEGCVEAAMQAGVATLSNYPSAYVSKLRLRILEGVPTESGSIFSSKLQPGQLIGARDIGSTFTIYNDQDVPSVEGLVVGKFGKR